MLQEVFDLRYYFILYFILLYAVLLVTHKSCFTHVAEVVRSVAQS